MKLLNIFKKETSKTLVSKAQPLAKNQLKKIVGGLDTVVDPTIIDDKIVKGPGKSTTGANASGA